MEYIKKEDLIEDEIYKSTNGSLYYIMKLTKTFQDCININLGIERLYKQGNFNDNSLFKFSSATSEEKHWLESCIKKDKFISFEEAMKTFIPEYVEWVDNIGSGNLGYQTQGAFQKNKIFKTNIELPTAGFQTQDWKKHLEIYPNNYKPSTKEAYDAQFVVKEPEFVLPEKWVIKITKENKPIIQQCNHLNKGLNYDYTINGYYGNKCGGSFILYNDNTEITFEQFKKYVLKEEIVEEKGIEPLPQFKVIESIETITKVENNEGNQFFIGDKVSSVNGVIYTIITGFKYNEDKTNIIALFNHSLDFGENINKLEHYIEPKVDFILPENWHIVITNENIDIVRNWWNNKNYGGRIWKIGACYGIDNKDCISKAEKRYLPVNNTEITFDQFKKYVLKEEELSPIQLANIEHPELAIVEESLLDKAKRLYPIGTKFNNFKLVNCGNRTVEVLTTNIIEQFGKINLLNPQLLNNQNAGTWTLYKNGEWAEIIEYSHGFKVGDKIRLKYGNAIYQIIKIEGNQLFFETNYLPKINSILAKNVIKVK